MRGSARGRAALAPFGLVLASAALASSVAAQAPAVGAGGLDVPDAEVESPVWLLDDGRGDDLRWDDLDTSYDPLPRGPVHFVAQLRLGGIAGSSGQAAQSPAAEVAAILDIRWGLGPWHLRLGAVLDLRWSEPVRDPFVGVSQSSVVSMRARLQPVAIDIGNVVAVRAGGDLGAQWVPDDAGGHFELLPAFHGELAIRLLDATVELGPYGGVQWTASHTSGGWTSLLFQGVFGVFAAYVVP